MLVTSFLISLHSINIFNMWIASMFDVLALLSTFIGSPVEKDMFLRTCLHGLGLLFSSFIISYFYMIYHQLMLYITFNMQTQLDLQKE